MPRKKKEEESASEVLDDLAVLLNSELVKDIHKKHGDSIISRASEVKILDMPRIPTGIYRLDAALGGGFPAGRINLVYGAKSSSKTTTVLKAISQAQKMCANCWTFPDESGKCKCGKYREAVTVYIDAEGAFDQKWAAKQGVDLDKMMLSVPEYAEQSIDIADALLRSGKVDILVIDSLAYLVPSKEIEGATEKESMGIHARLINRAMRKFVSGMNIVGNETGRRPTLFLINQIRASLAMFGSPFTCPGGYSPGFAATTEVWCKPGQVKMDKESGHPLYVELAFKTTKNKCIRGSERVFLPEIGRFVAIKELAEGGVPRTVLGLVGSNISPVLAERIWLQSEEDEVFEVKTEGGYVIGTNSQHKFLTPTGWLELEDLSVGDWVGIPRKVSLPSCEQVWSKEEARVAGLLIGDGCITGDTGAYLINIDEEVIKRACQLAPKFGCELYLKPDSEYHWGFRNIGGGHKGKPNALYSWLRRQGIWGKRAWEKELPPEIFGQSEEIKGLFIGSLIATDGWITENGNRAGYGSTSRNLVEQLQMLLLSIGVRSSIRERKNKVKNDPIVNGRTVKSRRPFYELDITGNPSICALYDCVKWAGSKPLGYTQLRRKSDITDKIPEPLAGKLYEAIRNSSLTTKEAAGILGFQPTQDSWKHLLRYQKGFTSRGSISGLMEHTDELNEFTSDVFGDVSWVRITSITYVGREPTYDVQVSGGGRNLVVSDFIVHNSNAAHIEGQYRMMLTDTELRKAGQVFDEASLVEDAKKYGIMTKNGSMWELFGETYRTQSLVEVALLENEELKNVLRKTLISILIPR